MQVLEVLSMKHLSYQKVEMSEVIWFRPCGFLALLCILSIKLQVPVHKTYELGLETAFQFNRAKI